MILSNIDDNIHFTGSDVTIERPRINNLLSEALKKRLLVVTAAAGYGKSLTVSTFLKHYNAKKLWLQFTENDNIEMRFWNHFSAALEQLHPAIGNKFSQLGFPESSLFDLYNTIIDEEYNFSTKYVLVFDDCHLQKNKNVISFLDFLLQKIYIYDNISIILISRTAPKSNMMDLMMKGSVSFMNEDDLKFTKHETEEYLSKVIGKPPLARTVASIIENTKGWPFAVSLNALMLKQDSEHVSHVQANAIQSVSEMINAAVFTRCPAELQRFLVKLSLLNNHPIDLIKEIAGTDDLIQAFENTTAFVRHDLITSAYRIHSLFLDFLRERQSILSEDEKQDTYVKAAEWCMKNSLVIESAVLYAKAGCYDECFGIIYHDYLLKMPVDAANLFLKMIEEAPQEKINNFCAYYTCKSRALLSIGCAADAIEMANKVIEEYSVLPETEENCRVLSAMYESLGLSHLKLSTQSNAYDFDKYFAQQDYYYTKYPNDYSHAETVFAPPIYMSTVGTDKENAIDEFISALERAVPHCIHARHGCMAGMDMLAKAELFFFRADMKNATVWAENALIDAKENHQFGIYIRALYYLLRIRIWRGKYEDVLTVLKQLDALLGEESYAARYVIYDIIMAWYYMTIEQPGRIAPWLTDGLLQLDLNEYLIEFSQLVKAKMLYAAMNYESLTVLTKKDLSLKQYLYAKIELHILDALAYYKMKNCDQSIAALEDAYALSRSNDLIFPFIEHGKSMRTLIAFVKKRGCAIPPEWLDRVQKFSSTYAKRLNKIIADYRKDHGMEQGDELTKIEHEVLCDMVDGMSRTEIAAARKLSINTIKTMMNIIYEKIGATSSADAIRIAIENELV